MWKCVCLAVVVSLFSGIALAAEAPTIPELFQTVKDQVKAGSWSQAAATLDLLDAEAAKPGNEKVQSQLEAPIAFYRGVCEANLGRTAEAGADFESFLRLQPGASIDRAAYSTKAIAAFDEAVRVMGESKPTLPRLYQDFRVAAEPAVPVTAAWGKGPASWLFSDAERSAWTKLKTDSDRATFVDAFWSSRETGSGHAFRAAFDKRVAFSDAYFEPDDKTVKPGSMTDRGMVFILLGAPLYARRSVVSVPASIAEGNKSPGTPAMGNNGFELWYYRKSQLPKGVSLEDAQFEFISNGGGRSNVLREDRDLAAILKAARKAPA